MGGSEKIIVLKKITKKSSSQGACHLLEMFLSAKLTKVKICSWMRIGSRSGNGCNPVGI